MIAQAFSADAPTTASSPGATARMDYSTHLTTMLWPAILVVAAVLGSLALTCVIPFAAFAVATAGTLRLRSALGTMAVMWLINQAVGFGALGYPWTLNTVLWGLAIGAAGLSATFAASAALHRFRSSPGWVRLPIAFVTAFVLYEVALVAVAVPLGGAAFAPAIVGRFALISGAWLAGLVLLHEILAAWVQPQLGASARLARAS